MNTKAFSLVELLASVAVLGVLAAISMSNFTVYKNRSYETELLTALRNIRIGGEVLNTLHQFWYLDLHRDLSSSYIATWNLGEPATQSPIIDNKDMSWYHHIDYMRIVAANNPDDHILYEGDGDLEIGQIGVQGYSCKLMNNDVSLLASCNVGDFIANCGMYTLAISQAKSDEECYF